jgi:hypothetical protein
MVEGSRRETARLNSYSGNGMRVIRAVDFIYQLYSFVAAGPAA